MRLGGLGVRSQTESTPSIWGSGFSARSASCLKSEIVRIPRSSRSLACAVGDMLCRAPEW